MSARVDDYYVIFRDIKIFYLNFRKTFVLNSRLDVRFSMYQKTLRIVFRSNFSTHCKRKKKPICTNINSDKPKSAITSLHKHAHADHSY